VLDWDEKKLLPKFFNVHEKRNLYMICYNTECTFGQKHPFCPSLNLVELEVCGRQKAVTNTLNPQTH
jgi:hypothetical protein